MKNPRVLFFIIILLTIGAILLDLPQQIPISLHVTIPVIGKSIAINTKINGFNPSTLFGPSIQKFTFHKGLDLEGGTSIRLKANMKGIPQESRSNALESAKTVIERRVNYFGVSEPVVQAAITNQDYRLIIELPGITDINQAIQLVGTTAQLSFWEDGASQSGKLTTPSTKLPPGITSIFHNPVSTNLTGNDLQKTTVTFDPNTGQPQVQLLFTSDGAKKFEDITRRNINKQVAIVLDNQVIEAPTVNQVISGGNAVISGSFTTNQANSLSVQLNAGVLPVPMTVLEEKTIGATLGESSLSKSLFAGILGFIIIVVFMSILYGKLGMLASFALLLYTLFVLALFKVIPVTLTLAGIAGFILSIGMAVDGYMF